MASAGRHVALASEGPVRPRTAPPRVECGSGQALNRGSTAYSLWDRSA